MEVKKPKQKSSFIPEEKLVTLYYFFYEKKFICIANILCIINIILVLPMLDVLNRYFSKSYLIIVIFSYFIDLNKLVNNKIVNEMAKVVGLTADENELFEGLSAEEVAEFNQDLDDQDVKICLQF